MRIKRDKHVIWGFLFILFLGWNYMYAPECKYCCQRFAILSEFTNKHYPDFEKDLEEWNECMKEQLKGYETFLPDDPKLQDALKKCQHLDPGSTEYMYPISVETSLAQYLTTEYFHMLASFSQKTPDYVFKGSYEADINDGSTIGKGALKGKPCHSRFTLELYYNGQPQELIKRWVTERSHKYAIPAHYQFMFKNRSAETKPDRPIHEKLLWDFEKIPVSCSIDPEKNTVVIGEEIEMKIKDFKDYKGRKSREFNRILVQSLEGEILNGEPSKYHPDCKVFDLSQGTIKVKYKAPLESEIKEDKIQVFNSCDILDKEKLPLMDTRTKNLIAEQKFSVIGTAYGILIEATSHHHSKSEDAYSIEDIKVSLRGEVDLDFSSLDYPEKKQYFAESLKVKSLEISSFEGSYVYKDKDDEKHCSLASPKLLHRGEVIVLFINSQKEKVIWTSIPQSTISFSWEGDEECRSDEETFIIEPVEENELDELEAIGEKLEKIFDAYAPPDKPEKEIEEYKEKVRKKMASEKPESLPPESMLELALKAANLAINNPPFKDYLVTSGDGRESFGGSGRVSYEEITDDGFIKTKETFTWKISKR